MPSSLYRGGSAAAATAPPAAALVALRRQPRSHGSPSPGGSSGGGGVAARRLLRRAALLGVELAEAVVALVDVDEGLAALMSITKVTARDPVRRRRRSSGGSAAKVCLSSEPMSTRARERAAVHPVRPRLERLRKIGEAALGGAVVLGVLVGPPHVHRHARARAVARKSGRAVGNDGTAGGGGGVREPTALALALAKQLALRRRAAAAPRFHRRLDDAAEGAQLGVRPGKEGGELRVVPRLRVHRTQPRQLERRRRGTSKHQWILTSSAAACTSRACSCSAARSSSRRSATGSAAG